MTLISAETIINERVRLLVGAQTAVVAAARRSFILWLHPEVKAIKSNMPNTELWLVLALLDLIRKK